MVDLIEHVIEGVRQDGELVTPLGSRAHGIIAFLRDAAGGFRQVLNRSRDHALQAGGHDERDDERDHDDKRADRCRPPDPRAELLRIADDHQTADPPSVGNHRARMHQESGDATRPLD